jgi:hypothetical protein
MGYPISIGNNEMTDLFDVQYRMLKKLEADEKGLDDEEILALAIKGISTASHDVIAALYKQKGLKRKSESVSHTILVKLQEIIEWTTMLHYSIGIDTPEYEDITSYADNFEDEMAADGVLCMLNVQRGLANIGISFFTDEVEPEELDQDLGEIFAGCELLARQHKASVSDIVNGQTATV